MLASQALGSLKFVCCALPARGLRATLNWELSRKFWFSFLCIVTICAKLLHIYAHWDSIPLTQLLLWGSTFFLQDIIFLMIGYVLTLHYHRKWACVLAGLVVVPMSLVLSVMAAANTSFFFLTGAEIHWRQAGSVNRDPASVNTLLTGLTGLVIVEVIFFIASIFASPYPFHAAEAVIGVWVVVVGAVFKPLARFALGQINRLGRGRNGSQDSISMSLYR
ncbi:hypothetical protein N7470_001376 [Penicillium chermesinum]|nr:hypothetical protein N7470_001376 [Penicillium chermesinum]